MTETPEVGPDTEAEGWQPPAPAAAVVYPEFGPLPEAPLSVNFTPGRAPQLTVRAHTPAGLTAALSELEEDGVFAAIGEAHTALGAQATIGAGLGPTTPVPPAPAPSAVAQEVATAYPTPAPVPPSPAGPAPAAWQQGGAPAAAPGGAANNDRYGPKPRPAWPQVFKITVPRGDTSFKAYREANQQYFKGKVQFAGNGQYWVAGDVAQSLAQWNPVPA